MKYISECLVKSNIKIIDDIYMMEIESNRIANVAKAGQFVQIRVSQQTDPLLRRPISINEIHKEKGTFIIYYKVVGKGTDILSNIKEGQNLNVVGPLGNGFYTEYVGKKIAIIGGGIGTAPLLQLAKELKIKNTIYTYLGFNDETYLINQFAKYSDKIKITTVTGKHGIKGFVVGVLEKDLEKDNIDLIMACGPTLMLKRVSKIAEKRNLECQLSLEERMACGFGACLGCSIEMTNGKMKKVCTDGPVFWSYEVKFDE